MNNSITRAPKTARAKILALVAGFFLLSVAFAGPIFTVSSNSLASGGASSMANGSDKGIARAGTGLSEKVFNDPVFSSAPQAAPSPITTYEATCTTPQNVFHVGDTVCVKVTGIQVGGFFQRSLSWGAPDSTLVRSTLINADPKTDTLLINATSTVNGQTIDNRGVWTLVVRNPFFFFPEATATFTVLDAANPTADLGVFQSAAEDLVAAGHQVVFNVQVNNYGPDGSNNVQLLDVVPANTTFVSFNQLSGPVFSCSSPTAGGTGTTTCTIANLPADSAATFVATYLVDNGTAIDTEISNTASVSSQSNQTAQSTPDSNGRNDSSTATATVAAAPCVLTCPSDITRDADSGQAGATITYTTPTYTGDCGTQSTGEGGEVIPVVSCSPASGSFFGPGTTPVICTTRSGAVCTFQVTVNNPGGLSITLNGASSVTVECGADFNDPGASAVNASGQPVSVTVSSSPAGFNADDPANGTYTLTYTATEDVNSVSTTRTVVVADTQAPSITVSGANPYKIPVGSCQPFVDPGASATDQCAGAKPVTTAITGPAGNHVDNNVAGTYTVTYTATDGTRQATATRTVIVGNFSQDESDLPDSGSAPPTITLNGDDQISIECGTPFTDPGATAAVCGAPVTVTTSGTVDVHAPATYIITYSATANGQTTTANRSVTVTADASAPTIQILGANPMTVECHTSFTDPGATAHDACAGDFAATASGTVLPNVVGTYVITYSATDPSGFSATPVTRTVNVVDTTNPVVTAPANVTVYTGSGSTTCSTVVSDATLGTGTATDSCQGSLSVTRSGVPAGNVFPVGTTTVTYSATDASNNTGTATQTVTVIDNTAPVITLTGFAPSMWPPNHKYQTFQLTQFVSGASDNCTNLSVNDVVIEKVTSDETENGNGDGNTLNDIVIASDCRSVQLRSERQGGGDGRVYTITFKVTDASGNVTRATATVVVAHNPGQTPVNSGVNYTVTCP
jgi:uncharacterized repeat protein (TIGR01451 family)